MRNEKQVLVSQLDRKMSSFKSSSKITLSELGWIKTIRMTINMTLEQLGKRLNMSKQGVKKLEEREASGALTLNALKEVGEALDMHFVYGFIPKKGSLEKLIEARARELATTIVMRTHKHMQLEDQATNTRQIKKAIDDLAYDLKNELRKSLWV